MTKQKGGLPCAKAKQNAQPPLKKEPMSIWAADTVTNPGADNLFGTDITRRLCEDISQKSGGMCLLAFSRGKDALASWLYLRHFFKTIIPFHLASVPHLGFVDKSLAYYEEFFKVPILRMMHGHFGRALAYMVFQYPGYEEDIDKMEIWEYETLDIVDVLRQELKMPDLWCAFGIGIRDSIFRRFKYGKTGGLRENQKTFYPCFDWTKKQILDIIKDAGLKLAGDYKLSNRTLCGLPQFRWLKKMREIYPDDYDRVKLFFPAIDAELAKYYFRDKILKKASA